MERYYYFAKKIKATHCVFLPHVQVKCPGAGSKPGRCIDDAPPSTSYTCEKCPAGYDKDPARLPARALVDRSS